MDFLKQYNIDFQGLDNDKEYEFTFDVNKEFFEIMKNPAILGGDVSVSVLLTKKSDSLFLRIEISGFLITTCSRCLDELSQEVDHSDTIAVRFGDENSFDTNEPYVTIERNANSINISHFIYEFCDFALPLKSVHPNTKEGKPGCDKEMIEILENLKADENKTDPRWEDLKKIMN